MNTVLGVNSVNYTAAQRAAASIGLDDLNLFLDDYDSFSCREFIGNPVPSFKHGWPVTVTIDGTLRFSGFITDVQTQWGATGWVHGYSCSGLRWFCDRFIPVTGEDGTGTFELNTPPDEIWSFSTDRGLDVGTILKRLFTIPATAAALAAAGVQYASLSPPTLPASTLADFALMTVVPAQSALFTSNGIFAQASQFISRWMPRFALQLQPDGTIRAKDTTDTTTAFPPRTFTLASSNGPGDPLLPPPSVRSSISQCATNVRLRGGPQVEGAILSLADGTLAEGFTSTDKANWNYSYFTNPKDGEDSGTVISCTSTSATIRSSNSSTTWATNFWAGRAGVVSLINSTATTPLASVSPYIQRQITSCDAMSAGGTAVVRWDAAWPSAESDFTTYRIVAGIGGQANTWRLYLPRDPGTGNTGLNTRIGQNLVWQSPTPIYWSNKTATIGEYYSQGVVVGPNGNSWPLGVTPVPSLGGWLFIQPTVTVFGNPQQLASGSPTTVAAGKPADVQIFGLYSLGALTATYPANDMSGHTVYTGTASSTWKVTQTIDVPSWTWGAEASDMNTLAQEHLKTMSDIVYDVTLNWVVNAAGVVPSWSFLDFAWSLNIAINGTTSPWSAINCPVRAIRIAWQGTPVPQTITFHASNQRKPFTGDELYTHPQFAGTPALASVGQGGGEHGFMTNGWDTQSDYTVADVKSMNQQKGLSSGWEGLDTGSDKVDTGWDKVNTGWGNLDTGVGKTRTGWEAFNQGGDGGLAGLDAGMMDDGLDSPTGGSRRRPPTPTVQSTSLRGVDAATPQTIEEQQQANVQGVMPRTLADQQADNAETARRVVSASDRQHDMEAARQPVAPDSIAAQQERNAAGAATPLTVAQQQERNASNAASVRSIDDLRRDYGQYADLGKAPGEDG